MPTSMLTSVYEHAWYEGIVRYFVVGGAQRYFAVSRAQMRNWSIYRELSSARVFASSTADATLLLFRSPYVSLIDLFGVGSFPQIPDYDGEFLQITNRRGADATLDVGRFRPLGFNDEPTSILLVAANKDFEYRLSFRDLFLQEWQTNLGIALGGTDAGPNGDAVLTWEMFPPSDPYLSPNRSYLKIHQPLRIYVNNWFNYDASMTYHIYLYLDDAGQLRGYATRWAWWVESGIISDEIGAILGPLVQDGFSLLDEKIQERLDDTSQFYFRDLYYLPGRQISRARSGTLTGNTTDDVTIVLEFL